MTVRELLKAHNVKTLDEQDELLVKLAQDRDALLAALKAALAEEEAYDRGERVFGKWKSQARAAIAQAEAPR